MTTQSLPAEGPYFDELVIGQEFGGAPGLTLTSGLAAAHQAITGDRLALATDHELCREVTGGDPLAPPSLVWDVAIGQSTVVTQHVKANLFYRGLAFRRVPRLGDTLRTSTRVVALRQNQPREGRAPTGLAARYTRATRCAARSSSSRSRSCPAAAASCICAPGPGRTDLTGHRRAMSSTGGTSPSSPDLSSGPRPGHEPADPCRSPDASARIFILDSILYV